MAKSMGINSPLLDDIFDENRKPVPKKSVKRSVRRTTMLPPELNRTLNETFGTSSNNSMIKNRRRSSRLEAMHVVPTTKSFKNPLEVKSNWTIFDQEKHNSNILNMINSANLQMLQKLPVSTTPKFLFDIKIRDFFHKTSGILGTFSRQHLNFKKNNSRIFTI